MSESNSNSKPNSESEDKAYTESPDDVMTLCSYPKMTPQERYEFHQQTKPRSTKTKIDTDIIEAS